MNMWTELQTAALDALGIPRYLLNHTLAKTAGEPVHALETVPVDVAKTSATVAQTPSAQVETPAMVASLEPETEVLQNEEREPQPVLYQLGPWLLQFPQALPVNYYPWLKDLSQFIESRPTQVGAAGSRTIIDCAFVAKDELHQDEKRALWQQLKPFLNQ